jgi:hypothetical protein
LYVKNFQNNVTWQNGTYFELTDVEILQAGAITNEPAFYFNYVTVNSIWGKLKQADIYKAYLQQYCAILQVNEETKVITIDKFDTIQDNIANALDWSDKIDYTDKPEINFALDNYGQRNNLEYKEDESVIKPLLTDYVLTIDDETLESENDLIESVYAATQNVIRLEDVSVPQIKIYTTDEDAVTEPTENVEQRILLLDRVDSSDLWASGGLVYTDGTSDTTVTTDIPIAWFIRSDKDYNLGFGNNLVALYWQGLIDVLNRSKIVSANIRLNAVDINALDFLIPVYIAEYNCYFYISKISNYEYGSTQSTTVELVKLR